MSIVSVWEIAIKDSLKKIELKHDFGKIFSNIIEKNNINILGLNIEHIKRLRKLPFHHRDPFDRIIIAQSIAENIELLYTDKLIKKYIWDKLESAYLEGLGIETVVKINL